MEIQRTSAGASVRFESGAAPNLSHQRTLVRQYHDGPSWRNVTDART